MLAPSWAPSAESAAGHRAEHQAPAGSLRARPGGDRPVAPPGLSAGRHGPTEAGRIRGASGVSTPAQLSREQFGEPGPPGVQVGAGAMEPPAAPSERSMSLSLPGPREVQATLKPPPQHLWRQPRTPIRIQQRGYSDSAERAEPERQPHRPIERADAVDTGDRPGLRTSRMSWPSSFHGTGTGSGSAGGGSCRR